MTTTTVKRAAQGNGGRSQVRRSAPPPANAPRIDITNERLAFAALSTVLADPAVAAKLYERAGGLWRIEVHTIGSERKPIARRLGADQLRAHFSQYVDTYVRKQDRATGEWMTLPASVMQQTCATILGRESWPGVPTLRGIITSPVLRPDRTILTAPGYDPATGLYHHDRLGLAGIPPRPTPGIVEWAKRLLSDVFGDFPWVARSDRAQYYAGLFTPIIRPLVPGPTPLIVISASSPGTGKSLLKDVHEFVFGAGALPWPGDDQELRKAITAKLLEGGEPVIGMDNLPSGCVIRSATLAALLTLAHWGDRVLGSSASVTVPNDRLWIVTGNNLRTGGDLGRRTVWVRLDANCPHPDRRSGFKVGDLRTWLKGHSADLLRALVVLVADWAAAGAPRQDVRMGDYSPWAGAIGGLLAHIGAPGWLEDRDTTALAMDEELAEWAALLAEWERIYGDAAFLTTSRLLSEGRLNEVVPRRKTGEIPSPRQLGQWFSARRGRYYAELRLTSVEDQHTHQQLWRVERYGQTNAGDQSSGTAS